MKGLEFVAVDPGIAKDPRIASMAAQLKRDRFWVAGHFPAFFGEVAIHAENGDLSGIPDDLLDEWAGNVKGWGAAVRRWLCEDGVLRSWWKYNGGALRNLRRDRERKRNPRGNSTEIPRKFHAGSEGTVTRTETSVSHETEIIIAAREAIARDALEFLPDFNGAIRAASAPDALVRECEALIRGMHLPSGAAASWPVIGQALRDCATNGEKVTARRLRIFVGDLLKPRMAPAREAEVATGWDRIRTAAEVADAAA